MKIDNLKEPIRIFVGYDEREPIAYHVFCESLISNAAQPLSITPLSLKLIARYYDEAHSDGSNQFIYSRFLVPFLSNFEGFSIFFDGDMVLESSLAELLSGVNPMKAVSVVKHDYKTKYPKKYFGNVNEDYPRKNWSSVIVFNNSHTKNHQLTPEFVSSKSGSYLHRFSWLHDDEIGALASRFNWLVDEYPPNECASLYHYTVGIPCIEGFTDSSHANRWFHYHKSMHRGYEIE